jgi:hypothetical protein
MAESTLQEVEVAVLTAALAGVTAAQPTITAWIAGGEAEVVPTLTALFKEIPSVKGLLGAVAGPILTAVESGIEAYVAQLVAKETPAVLYGYVVAWLQLLIKDASA